MVRIFDRYLFQFEPMATGGVVGLTLSVVSYIQDIDWTRFLAPGWFSITLLMLMTGEILTCFYTHPPLARKKYNWEHEVQKKLMIASLGIISLILDSIIMAIVHWLPWWEAGAEFPIWGSGFLPITLSTLLWLNTAEAIRMVMNISRSTGDANIPPTIMWVIRQLRRADAARMPAGAKPEKRLLDNITEDDIRDLLSKMENMNEPAPPIGDQPVEIYIHKEKRP